MYRYRKSRDDQPLAMPTQRMRLMAITGMLKRLYNLNKLSDNFYKGFDLPKVKRRSLLDVPTEEDVELIIAQTLSRGFIGVRDKAILEVYYATGIRRAELSNLDLRGIDYKNQFLKVRGGKGGGDRQVPMAPRTIYAIKEYLETVRPVLASLNSSEALFIGMTGNRPESLHSTLQSIVRLYSIF